MEHPAPKVGKAEAKINELKKNRTYFFFQLKFSFEKKKVLSCRALAKKNGLFKIRNTRKIR